MTTAIKTHAEIQAEQSAAIFRALANKGTACQQSPEGERIGPYSSAAGALAADISTDDGEIDETVSRLFSAVALGYSDQVVAMHARSLAFKLVRNAADLNATALENGEAVPVRFKEF